MQKSTKTQTAIYSYIVSFTREHSYPPTVREIGAAVGLRSTSTVHTHLHRLVDRGLISIDSTRQRSICICADEANNRRDERRVPLVGSVAAGLPILAAENIEESYFLPSSMLRGAEEDEAFMLNVRGESMTEAGICDGDTIIINKGMSCGNGDIVVARVDSDTVTVKRLFFEPDGRIRLQPENSTMKPIFVSPENVEIVGRVIGLYRRY